ncbi:MAG: OmpA family protein [Planctomycetota bacterium]
MSGRILSPFSLLVLLAACETGRPNSSTENENLHLHGVIRSQEKRIDDLTQQRNELERRMDALEKTGGPTRTASNPAGGADEPTETVDEAEPAPARSDLTQQVAVMLERFKSDSDVEVEQTADGYRFVLREKVLFGAASADLSDDGRQALGRVADALRGGTTMVLVEGHTDNTAISKPETQARYPKGNIELSVARALAVWDYLANDAKLEGSRLAVVGYGPHRPRVPNDSDRNRYRNRRVEIRITEPR